MQLHMYTYMRITTIWKVVCIKYLEPHLELVGVYTGKGSEKTICNIESLNLRPYI